MSASIVGFTCSLCLSKRPLTECRLLRCYHGFCAECIKTWLKSKSEGSSMNRLSCPECRKPVKEDHLAPMFVNVMILDQQDCESQDQTQIALVEKISTLASYVSKDIQQMGPKSEVGVVARSARELEVIASATRSRVSHFTRYEKVTKDLVRAVEDFKVRLEPVFEQVAVQKERLETLRKEINGITAENMCLAQENDTLQKSCTTAIQLNEKYANRVKELTISSTRMVGEHQDEIVRLINSSSAKDAEIRRLTDAYREKEEELTDCLAQISQAKLEIQSLSSSRGSMSNPAVSSPISHIILHKKSSSDRICVSLSSSDEDEPPYPTLTSPSLRLGANLRQNRKNLMQSVKQRPKFRSDWNLEKPVSTKKRKTSESEMSFGFPLKLDDQSRPIGSVVVGSRRKFGNKS